MEWQPSHSATPPEWNAKLVLPRPRVNATAATRIRLILTIFIIFLQKFFLKFSFRQTGCPVYQDPCLCVPTLRWVYSFRRFKCADSFISITTDLFPATHI